ncbi:MAG TPA: hypothetical protein VFQ53_05760 [Kofleriaceae bacterium]|nr:hypothetical protein [Kofleriaceae bacterium]
MGDARPGIVDLRDLNGRFRHTALHIDRLVAAARLARSGDRHHRFAPPQVVVAIASDPVMIEQRHAWLAEAERVVIVIDTNTDDGDRSAEIEAAGRGLPAVFALWTDDTSAREIVELAVAIAGELPARTEPPAPPFDDVHDAIELPPSSWCEVECDPRAVWRGLVGFADQLLRRGDTAVLTIDPDGHEVDLASLPRALRILAARDVLWQHESRVPTPASRRARALHPGWIPLGVDPVHPVGWRGDRMSCYWEYRGSFLASTDGDYPCGPEKKLYGFSDNDPVQVTLAPDASAFVARFEHDVLVTSAVPIAWRPHGAVDVATFERDPHRAVLFAQDADDPGPREPDIDPLEGDARDLAPVVVLGPDDRARYAVDLRHLVYRITQPETGNAVAVAVGGPHAGYAVFDAEHRLVRRGDGRLVGGWVRWATIEHGGLYWREDLATGARVPIAVADRRVCIDPDAETVARDAILAQRFDHALQTYATHPVRTVGSTIEALAIPGTRNVLLVSTDKDASARDGCHIRVI